MARTGEAKALNPQPSTLNPQPSTLNPQPSTLNPQPSTLNPQPSTLNPQPSTLNPQPFKDQFMPDDFGPGVLLCMLCILLWSLCVYKARRGFEVLRLAPERLEPPIPHENARRNYS